MVLPRAVADSSRDFFEVVAFSLIGFVGTKSKYMAARDRPQVPSHFKPDAKVGCVCGKRGGRLASPRKKLASGESFSRGLHLRGAP